MAAQSSQSKTTQTIIGLCVMGGISIFVCCGCFGSISSYLDKQAEYANSPEGKAEAKKREQEQQEKDLKFHRERMPWIMAEKFCEQHLRGEFDSKPISTQETEDGTFLVSGNMATPDGVVHRIVAEVSYAGEDNWRCRALWIDAQQVR